MGVELCTSAVYDVVTNHDLGASWRYRQHQHGAQFSEARRAQENVLRTNCHRGCNPRIIFAAGLRSRDAIRERSALKNREGKYLNRSSR